MQKDTFIAILKENKPEKMMDYLLNNGKKPKPFNPFRFLSVKEMEEFKNGTDTNNERTDG